ncbi:hypothetical protein LAWI1_G003145 [Lachnellula willkommii]|uniref:Uncharacterized protein n=1 Tax=Lachnellula willkommii TaxID=215461 RepID=A0A559MLZ0_9HELO|nr:hypothetical protein LAWI1_G003145 [Lachnellula willkommii]
MTMTVEIHSMIEAKQRLHNALNILDAISVYSINHRLSSDQLFDIDVRKRLQSLCPKLPSPIYFLLKESVELSEDEKNTLSPYCYKIEDSADDFDDVLGGLEAYYKQMNAQNLASKGELIDTIIRGGVSKTIRAVAGILDVIGSLALWHIREVEARTLATKRGHKLGSQEDKSNAATEMWQHLSGYNSNADRAKLDARITAGIRWNKFLGRSEIGMIVTVHKLPPSLKFPTKLIDKLALTVTDMPGILDQARKATPCMQKLLDSRLGPWTGSKKRPLSVHTVLELGPKRRRPGTEAESDTPGGNSNSIGALLNAAEHIAAATQGQQLPSARSSSTPDRIDSHSPQSLVPEEIHPLASEEVHATASGQPEIWSNRGESRGLESQVEALDQHRKRRRLNSSFSSIGLICEQGGATEETSLGGANAKDTLPVVKIAIMAEVDKLEGTLGAYLFRGMDTTHIRQLEKDKRCNRFTDTVCLHVPVREGEDYKLEIWLCASVGKAVSQAIIKPTEDLRNVLGDYLFEGASHCTGAITMSCPNGNDGRGESSDWKMELMLSPRMGLNVYKNVFAVD